MPTGRPLVGITKFVKRGGETMPASTLIRRLKSGASEAIVLRTSVTPLMHLSCTPAPSCPQNVDKVNQDNWKYEYKTSGFMTLTKQGRVLKPADPSGRYSGSNFPALLRKVS